MRVCALLPCLALCLLWGAWPGVNLPQAHAAEVPYGKHLDLEADRYEHDFGQAGQNETRKTSITLTNTSDKRVEGIYAVGSCGCNEVHLSADALDPGASAKLDVTFNTIWLAGHVTKLIRVRTKDPGRGTLRIHQRVAITEGLVVAPHSVTFRDVRHGDKPSTAFEATWYEGAGDPFEITGVRTGHAKMLHTIEPVKDEKEPTKRGWRITITFAEPAVEGMLSDEVIVTTSHPKHPRITLPLSAHVAGHVWLQVRKLTFGAVNAGESRTTTIRFRPGEEGVVFGNVRATTKLGKVHVETALDPDHGDRGYWYLRATLPATTPPGRITDEVITLDVGAEGVAPIHLPVRAFVRQPRKPVREPAK